MIETGRRRVVEAKPGRRLLTANRRPALQGLRPAQAAP